MDQYPYSIPPGFNSYAGNPPEKNTDLPIESAVPGQNPYFATEVPPFGYVPPMAAQEHHHHQQQHLIPPNPVPIPSVHANGMMPSVPPEVTAGFTPYNNMPAYGGQLPDTAVQMPPMVAPVGIDGMYNAQSFDPQGAPSAQPSDFYHPPVSVVNPPAAVPPVDVVEPNATENVGPSETLIFPQDNQGPVADTVPEVSNSNAEIAVNEKSTQETVPNVVEDSNKESTQQAEASEPAASEETPDSPKEPPQTSLTTESGEPPVTENVDPAANEVSDDAPQEETDFPPKSHSPTPPRNLGASTEDVCATSVKKKRRRIMTLNDEEDSGDDDNTNRMELLRSPEPESTEANDVPGASSIADDPAGEVERRRSNEGNRSDDDSERNHDEDDGRPKSSTSGAASIFQNVVMIPAGGESEAHKRKKIRVLDSDDDEEEQKPLVNVDDIGLTGEGADDLNPGGLLVDENAENDDLGAVDGIELDKMEQIVAMDAPIIDPSEMANEDEDDEDGGSNVGEHDENEKDTSDREGGEEEQEEEELGEEEEIVEEGVEVITAEDDDGEAIGIATDDEQELEQNVEPDAASEAAASDAAASDGSEGDDNRGSGADDEQASEVERSDAEDQSESEKSDKEESDQQEEEDDEQNDQSETRSTSTPVEQDKESQESDSKQRRKRSDETKRSDSDDDVVCQNDLELNTISLLTDEEDDNTTPLPPPKKELPVVRIVNIKKELLDDRFARREAAARLDAATSYQQQHYIKKQQQMAQKKREKQKKRSERTFDNNNPFGAWSSSSSDDEFIPNDIYFGTPDRVFTATTKIRCQRQKMLNDRYSKQSKTNRSNKRKYGEEPDADQRRKQKQKLEEISRLNLPTYQQQQLQTLLRKKKKNRPDRFYDKSQDIPNDIYFGNVNVPLHILHGFGDSSSDEERRGGNIWRTSQPSTSSTSRSAKYQSSSKTYKKASSSSSYKSPHSPSNDRSVQAMKEYLKIAGFKNVKFHKLWEGCKSNQERANAILRLMQEKGLEGEPTIAKCRELRKQLQMEREAQVLDTSLIIDSGEGRITRRSARNTQNQLSPGPPLDPNAPSTSGLSQPPAVPPESLETLNRIRNVIDPDSDGEE
ncbi:protein IWS1 homolog [Aedes aegypti]|uniref:Uncharacterized protein n=1 Tax=Aedes aegypti TaxID=7159 RepID=A0A6I8TRI2_AEDAE|nr:protein IWS1 homolog [Aedes aegypti]